MSLENVLSKELLAEELGLSRFVYLADTSSNVRKVNLSFQGKQLTVFVAYDRNLSFQVKLEFWKTSLYHHELDNFTIIQDFCDEIGGDISKNNFLGIM